MCKGRDCLASCFTGKKHLGPTWHLSFKTLLIPWLVSTYVVCERLSVMHKQVSGWTVNFLSKFSRKPLTGISDQKAPPPPILEKFIFEMTKVYSGIPPHFRKVQIWDDQSLLRNTPPISENAGDRMWRLICNPQGYHPFTFSALYHVDLLLKIYSHWVK